MKIRKENKINGRKRKTAVYGQDGSSGISRVKMKKSRTKKERCCQTKTHQEKTTWEKNT